MSAFGAWRSLVARAVRVGEVPGSNPGAPIPRNPRNSGGSALSSAAEVACSPSDERDRAHHRPRRPLDAQGEADEAELVRLVAGELLAVDHLDDVDPALDQQ